MAANINGLIYYKLDAQSHGYPGDITKNCGLRGEEIDGNFNFLRSHDIKSISFDEYGTMHLTRYNGEILTAKQADTPEYDFNYNPENGKLTIVTPDGKEITLDGFKVTTNVYHDFTLDGHGSQEFPLEVSNLAKTGRYKPAIKLLDTTLEDENGRRLESLPTENVAKHDRYVTREKISRFGRLFSLSGVEKIAERLERISSEWHIPTKEEWDEMLNVIDCATPDHDKTESNVYLGEFAGSALKSTTYWEPTKTGKVLSEDKYGFSIYPVGYCGNRGTKYYGSFGESSCFWTSTEEDNHKDMYVKTFDYNSEAVGQRTWGENYYLSVRLAKTFTGNNFNDAEDIDGFTSNCIHVPGTSTIWTKENIAFSQEQYDGFVPEEWEKYENIETDEQSYVVRYFVNDWNGNGWDKHEIKEGEGIVLYEGVNGRMHEWLLVNGELVDTSILLKEEFYEELDELNAKIEQEIADRTNADAVLDAKIEQEITDRTNADTALNDKLDAETTNRIESDEVLTGLINVLRNDLTDETTQRVEEDARINRRLDDEIAMREHVDNQITETLDKEIIDRTNADAVLDAKIEQEISDRTVADTALENALQTEINERVAADNVLQANINTEQKLREDADILLQQHIDENQVVPQDVSVVIVPGQTNDGVTVPTTIKVNLDPMCEHLKLGESGVYFDGYFGQF